MAKLSASLISIVLLCQTALLPGTARSLQTSNLIAFGEHETPESAEYINKAIALIRANRPQEAQPIIEEGLSKFPQSATLHFEYGNVLNQSDRYDEAIKEYKKAMELEPPFPEAMINTAYALVNSGKGVESLPIFEKYLQDYSNDPHISSVKAQYLLVQANQCSEQGRFFDAKKLLEEAAANNPQNAHVHFKLGRAFEELGNSRHAIQEYEEVLRLQPDHSAAAFNIAGCYQSMGSTNDAINWFQRYLSMSPNASDRQTIINMINKLRQKSMEPGSDPNAPDYVPAIAERGRPSRWAPNKLPLKIYIEKIKESDHFKESYRSDFLDALDDWSKASQNRLTFTIVKNKSKADITCDWTDNPYDVRQNGSDAEQGICRLKVTEYPAYAAIDTANIRLLTVDRENQKAINDDEMKKACLHELGHALGLRGHSTNNHDIMFFSMSPTVWPVLSKRDKATILRLYSN